MSHPILAILNLGGGEIILILMLLLILALPVAAGLIVVCCIIRASQKKSGPAQPLPTAPSPLPAQLQDLDQQLRTLAKLKEDGVISEEDFNAKKKALLGL